LFYKMLPLFKINLGDKEINNFLKIFIIPAFYHSFFNALFISISLFGVSILNYQKKHRVIAFFIPLILSTAFVFLFFTYAKPDKKNLTEINFNDARLFLTEKSFFEYNGEKIYFDKLERAKAKNLVIEKEGIINFYKEAAFAFTNENIILEVNTAGGLQKIEFKKETFQEYNTHRGLVKISFFSIFYNITNNFFYGKNIFSNVYLWFSIAFFLLALTIATRIKKYPLLSIFYNLIYILIFYYIFNLIFPLYQKYAKDFFSLQETRDIFFSSAVLFIGLVIYLIQIVFLKAHKWED